MADKVRWVVRLLVTQDPDTEDIPARWEWDIDAEVVVLSAEPVGIVAPDTMEAEK